MMAAGALAALPERARNAGDPGGALARGVDYEADLSRARALAELAADLGLEGPAELALRFALAKPGVSTALVGFSDAGQLASALRWAERGPLTPAAVEQVVAAAR
ncbi:MAG: aldo/keto reductase [Dehalococcoidia bacterium]